MMRLTAFWVFCLVFGLAGRVVGDQPTPKIVSVFLKNRCFECHDSDSRKGGLDLTALKFEPKLADNFAHWVRIDDRVSAGEMPPKKKPRPEASELKAVTNALT